MSEFKIKRIFKGLEVTRWQLLSMSVLASAAACSVLGFVSRANSGMEPTKPLPQQPALVQSLRVFVHGDDIYPLTARRRPGRLLVNAENETQSDIVVVFEKVIAGRSNQRVTSIAARVSAKRSAQEVTLGAGEYVFYEESHPDVRGELIVESR
jgi:hypothetical protein